VSARGLFYGFTLSAVMWALLAVLVILLAACSQPAQQVEASAPPASPQHVAAVKTRTVSTQLERLAEHHNVERWYAEVNRQALAAWVKATQQRRVVAVRKKAPLPGTPHGVWDQIQKCECPPGWHCNTGNGYFGGLQMDMTFWRSYGGPQFAPRPDLASREQQIVVAERARDSGRGYRPWPTCAKRLGLI
jgi:hypothetical protein